MGYEDTFLTGMFKSPIVIVYLVGIVLSVVFWQRNPQVSLLVLTAFCILVGLLAMKQLQYISAVGLARPVKSLLDFTLYHPELFRTIWSIGHAAAFGLLITAAFGWRNQPRSMPPIGRQE